MFKICLSENIVSIGNGEYLFRFSLLLELFYSSSSSHLNIPELCTTFLLSDFNVEQQQVYVEVTIPNHVPLQEPFQINYRIHNRSNIVHEYKVNLEQINLIIAVSGATMVNRRIEIFLFKIKKSLIFILVIITRSTT